MFAYNPKERINMEEVINHPWMTGPVPTDEEISEEFAERLLKVKEYNQK